jgi:hypothetical protein
MIGQNDSFIPFFIRFILFLVSFTLWSGTCNEPDAEEGEQAPPNKLDNILTSSLFEIAV